MIYSTKNSQNTPILRIIDDCRTDPPQIIIEKIINHQTEVLLASTNTNGITVFELIKILGQLDFEVHYESYE